MKEFYKIYVHVDMLDTNPTVTTYDSEWEAMDARHEAIEHAVQWRVDHSPYTIDEDELEAIREEESLLVKIHRGVIKSQ